MADVSSLDKITMGFTEGIAGVMLVVSISVFAYFKVKKRFAWV